MKIVIALLLCLITVASWAQVNCLSDSCRKRYLEFMISQKGVDFPLKLAISDSVTIRHVLVPGSTFELLFRGQYESYKDYLNSSREAIQSNHVFDANKFPQLKTEIIDTVIGNLLKPLPVEVVLQTYFEDEVLKRNYFSYANEIAGYLFDKNIRFKMRFGVVMINSSDWGRLQRNPYPCK